MFLRKREGDFFCYFKLWICRVVRNQMTGIGGFTSSLLVSIESRSCLGGNSGGIDSYICESSDEEL